MNGTPSKEPLPPQEPDDQVEKPDEVDEDQLDEALEETFPASDPISP